MDVLGRPRYAGNRQHDTMRDVSFAIRHVSSDEIFGVAPLRLVDGATSTRSRTTRG